MTRHAPVYDDDIVCWVAVARWVHDDGRVEWCLEYWEESGEAEPDTVVPHEAAAMERAREEFGIEDSDWRPGPQPWGRPEAPG